MEPCDDYCYECRGYGDDYGFNEDTQEFESNCVNCPYSDLKDWEDD